MKYRRNPSNLRKIAEELAGDEDFLDWFLKKERSDEEIGWYVEKYHPTLAIKMREELHEGTMEELEALLEKGYWEISKKVLGGIFYLIKKDISKIYYRIRK